MVCAKCTAWFPCTAWIEGRLRVLNKRKYCLTCSPWGNHNTKRLHLEKYTGTPARCICEKCHREFDYNKSRGHQFSHCNSCVVRLRHRRMKSRLVSSFGGQCIRCGYAKSISAMDFHHRDPQTKSFTIGHAYNRSWQALYSEALKCDILCANCHRESHEVQ